MKQIPELLFLALDCFRYPSPYDEKRSTSESLPPGISELLAVPDTCLSDDNIDATATDLAVTPDDCRAAVMLYVRLLLDAPGNHYRLLGLAPGAEQPQVKHHYQLLTRLLEMGWPESEPGWRATYRLRVEEAWQALREPLVHPVAEPVTAEDEPQAEPVDKAVDSPSTGQDQEPEDDAKAEPVPGPGLASGAAQGSELTAAPPPGSAAADESDTVVPVAEAVATPAIEKSTGKTLEELAENLVDKVEKSVEEPVAPETDARPVESGTAEQASLWRSPLLYVALLVLGVMLMGLFYAFSPEPAPATAGRQQSVTDGNSTLAGAADTADGKLTPGASRAEPLPVAQVSAPDREVTAESVVPEPEPAVEPITNEELSALLQSFGEHYENGDADAFAGLFSVDAQTSSGQGRHNISAYFQRVFAEIKGQRLRLGEVVWQPGGALREGEVRVSITAAPAFRGKAVTLENQLQFEVSRSESGELQISRLLF